MESPPAGLFQTGGGRRRRGEGRWFRYYRDPPGVASKPSGNVVIIPIPTSHSARFGSDSRGKGAAPPKGISFVPSPCDFRVFRLEQGSKVGSRGRWIFRVFLFFFSSIALIDRSK